MVPERAHWKRDEAPHNVNVSRILLLAEVIFIRDRASPSILLL